MLDRVSTSRQVTEYNYDPELCTSSSDNESEHDNLGIHEISLIKTPTTRKCRSRTSSRESRNSNKYHISNRNRSRVNVYMDNDDLMLLNMKREQMAFTKEFQLQQIHQSENRLLFDQNCMKEKLALKHRKMELKEREMEINMRKLNSEARMADIQVKAMKLKEQHALRNQGIPKNEIDALLPLSFRKLY